ncbi:MAG: radical SAM protein [Myxococcales bacterium]|nr:radical SAM protein [Myxococcales bacterium]
MSLSERRQATPDEAFAPRYVVWELTLKCDLACRHCGSRAGRPRAQELTLPECRDVVDELVALGTREIVFIGGEAYLHPKWLDIVAHAAARGVRCLMTTGGRRFGPKLAQRAADAGLAQVSVSIDGLRATHDELRAVPGSFDAALATLRNARAAGIDISANTQFNRQNLSEVEALADVLLAEGIDAWQVQVTGPMGRAADGRDWLLQPYDLLQLVPRLAAIARRAKEQGCSVVAGNNLGYFGPHESDLRAGSYFQGCVAGRYVLGIESNGDIKGCPSLPSAPYVGGNVRERPLAQIWAESERLAFARSDRTDQLWGHCATCHYAPVCQGGCSWTAHTLLGRRGNMPYCYHRAEQLKERGLRERVVQVERSERRPFDFGRFELVEESWEEST